MMADNDNNGDFAKEHDNSSISVDSCTVNNLTDTIDTVTITESSKSLPHCSIVIHEDVAGPSSVNPDVHILQAQHIMDDCNIGLGMPKVDDRLGRSNQQPKTQFYFP